MIKILADKLKRNVKENIRGVKNLLLWKKNRIDKFKPEGIWFEVTDRCNSHCKHCSIWRKKPTPNPLTVSEMEKTLRDPLFSGLKWLITSGGEPVLREDIEEIFLLQHKIFPKLKMHLSTNGILAERVLQVVKSLLQKNVPLGIGVSLDAIGEKHDFVRGTPGNYQKTSWLLAELCALRKHYSLDISIGFVLSPLTIDSFAEVKKFAEKHEISLTVQWYNTSSFYVNTIGKVKEGSDNNSQQMEHAIKSLPPNLLNEKWIGWLKGGSIKFPCFAMHTFIALKCNGDIVPCLNLWDNIAGNVREKTPSQIWISPESKEARRLVKNCSGCLNSWGFNESISALVYPEFFFRLRHTRLLIERLKKELR